jgi:hypothetical protein
MFHQVAFLIFGIAGFFYFDIPQVIKALARQVTEALLDA